MAVRQYVGARYVPKFADPVAWQSGTSYEALTIVTYNNASYTSKIPVPATVGNPADNDTYWALTGNYNAQVEAYREETVAVQENLNEEIQNREKAITDATTHYCVWIGDSYSTADYAHGSSNQPVNTVPKYLGCTLKNYSHNGAGFLRGDDDFSFNAQAQTAATDTSYDHSQVSHVIIFGGNNDAVLIGTTSAWTYAELASRANTCFNTLKSSFPNARIILIGINSPEQFQTPRNVASPVSGNCINELTMAMIYKFIAGNNGVAFIDTTLTNVGLHSCFNDSDGHPSNAGYLYLTSRIISGITGTEQYVGYCLPAARGYNSLDASRVWTFTPETITEDQYEVLKQEGWLRPDSYEGIIVFHFTATCSGHIDIKPPLNLLSLPCGVNNLDNSMTAFVTNWPQIQGQADTSGVVIQDLVTAQAVTGFRLTGNFSQGVYVIVKYKFTLQ